MRLRFNCVILLAVVGFGLLLPNTALAKTARNYANDWSAIGEGSLWPIHQQGVGFQQERGYTVYGFSQVNASNVYAALQIEGIVAAGSHASPGVQVYRNNGAWTCCATWARGAHTHTVGNDGPYTCDGTKNLKALAGANSPCLLVFWWGCDTMDDPSGTAESLPWASYRAGVLHNAGFSDHVYIDSWAGDFSYGYYKSLAAGNYTNAAMDAGLQRVKDRHLGLDGNYDSHDYVGANTKI